MATEVRELTPYEHISEEIADGALEPIGITSVEERIYRLLLATPAASITDIAQTAEMSLRHTRRLLADLELKGLASRVPGKTLRYLPAPPDIALEALIHSRQEQLERLRLSANELVDQFRHHTHTNSSREMVEVVSGSEAVLQRFKQIEKTARSEVLVFNKPPYLHHGLNDVELGLLKTGVQYRVVYDRPALEIPGQLEWMAELRGAGEEARILPELPMKLAIADRRLAIVPLYMKDVNGSTPLIEEALMVHPGSLLDALATNFEILWARAMPVNDLCRKNDDSDYGPLSDEDCKILLLMGAGLKDEAIARQMGMGARTVQRRVSRLMEVMGVQTRFQAGLQAGKLGWL